MIGLAFSFYYLNGEVLEFAIKQIIILIKFIIL